MNIVKSKILKRISIALSILVITSGFTLPVFASSGMLKIKGSDTMLPLAAAWAEAYMKKNPNSMVSVNGGGSGVGLAALINNTCDIGNSSRAAKSKEITQGRDRNVSLKATTVARDGLCVIVNVHNPINAISISDLAKLYTTANTWKAIGGNNAKVIAISRDSSSGTYVYFQDIVLKGKRYRPETITLPSTNAICQSVSQDEGAVGYVGIAYAKSFVGQHKIKIIPVNGVLPNDKTVKNGSYPLTRPLYCYTNGRPGGIIGDFLKFVLSSEGQQIVDKVGYVAL